MTEESFEHAGLNVKIEVDPDPLNPRTDYDNVGVMCCEHRRYRLGDGGMELLYKALTNDPRYSLLNEPENFPEPNNYQALIGKAEEWGYTVLPLYLYDHSGITMNTTGFSCPWDSGQVGIIFISPQTVAKEGIPDPETYLKAEVKECDTYLRGEVYGYIIKDKDGEELDSCWGFFELDYCKEEAKQTAEAISARLAPIEQLELAL